MLDVNLENIAKRMGDSASGKSTVDPKGYLTSLDSIQLSSDAEIGDIKKARMLLKSVINTNPKHAPGWVAAARLEETVGYVPVPGILMVCPSVVSRSRTLLAAGLKASAGHNTCLDVKSLRASYPRDGTQRCWPLQTFLQVCAMLFATPRMSFIARRFVTQCL